MIMVQWNFSDETYRFEYGGRIRRDDWRLDEENSRILQVIQPDFRLRICDLNVHRYIESRAIKVERSVWDYPKKLYVSSRADFKVPDGLFVEMHSGNNPEDWGIFEAGGYGFTDEFTRWLQGEFLKEEHWWSNDTCSLSEYEKEDKKLWEKFLAGN